MNTEKEAYGVPLTFRPADRAPLALSGLPWYARERTYCRLPQAVIPQTNPGVRMLAWHTAGAMVRFRTDSSAIGIEAVLRTGDDMSHMPRSGSGGFDLYEGAGTEKVFRANLRHSHGSTEVKGLLRRELSRRMREWTVYLPLYNGVEALDIGLDPECRLEAPTPFAHERPVLFYGSSITQGGCASRPGNSYTAIVGRRLNVDLINWGFSGNGKGEPVMAETIATLDLSAFVFDYDHNAPTVEHLAATHEPFFRIVRKARPDLPVIFVSRPDFYGTHMCRQRREIIRGTYERAVAAGDRNVRFVDGEILFGAAERDLCTVDGCHPNDIGFLRMADGMTPAVRAVLQPSGPREAAAAARRTGPGSPPSSDLRQDSHVRS